jgi:hypothetical protein
MAEGHLAKKQKLNPKSFLPSNTSFEQAMKNKTFFADKSHLIPFIEEEHNVIFCRPRRFGKSLILQMLMIYFDKRTDDTKFNEVFLSLKISMTYVIVTALFLSCFLALWLPVDWGERWRRAAQDRSSGQVHHPPTGLFHV